MPKLTYINNQKNPQPAIPIWQETVKQQIANVMALPQVKSGQVSQNKATKWLEAIAKTHTPANVNRLIQQQQGFTAAEMRSLWAHDQGEYYAQFEPQEVYALKNLEAFKTSDFSDKKSHLLNKLFFEVAKRKFGFEEADEKQIQKQSVEPKQRAPWLQNENVRMVTYTDPNTRQKTLALVDLKINYDMDFTQSDLIRHHYNQLSIANKGIYCTTSYQLNVKTKDLGDPYLDMLFHQAKHGPEAFDSVVKILSLQEMRGEISLHNEVVEQTKEIYDSLRDTGNLHYGNILNGRRPEFNAPTKAQLTEEEKQAYEQHAKTYAIARQAKETATKHFDAVKQDLPKFVLGLNKGLDFDNPYPLARVGKRSEIDLEKVIYTLNQHKVDPAHYEEPFYAIDELVKAAQRKGIDTNQYKISADDHKKRINSARDVKVQKAKDCLIDLGYRVEDFQRHTHHTHISPQSRGVLADVKNNISQAIDKNLENLETKLKESSLMDLPKEAQDVVTRRKTSMGAK